MDQSELKMKRPYEWPLSWTPLQVSEESRRGEFKENFSFFTSLSTGESHVFVYVIAWVRGQLLRINFTSIFTVCTKFPESRSDEGNLENFENTSEVNP